MKKGKIPTTSVECEQATVLTDNQIKMEGQLLIINKTRNSNDVEIHIRQEQKTIRLLSINYVKALIHELCDLTEKLEDDEDEEEDFLE